MIKVGNGLTILINDDVINEGFSRILFLFKMQKGNLPEGISLPMKATWESISRRK